jgi:hypothetical protein
MTMSTNRITAEAGQLGYAETPGWISRFGETASKVLDAFAAGRAAAHDYNRLSTHGATPQEASAAVFQKHFGAV